MDEADSPFITGLEHLRELQRKTKVGTPKHPAIVRYFNKTPSTIVCPHFYELNWAYGCNFDCAYCYLQGTFRGNKDPRHIPLNEVIHTLQAVFDDRTFEPSVFNSGELTDSLVYPPIMEQISDKFEEQKEHKLLLLTKSSNVRFLVKKPRKQTIASFSVNSSEVSRRWENQTPSPDERIDAARRVADAGYEVRMRIDPIFPIEDWKSEYGRLCESLLSEVVPKRITLGTPRGLQKTLVFSKDLSWAELAFERNPSEDSGWGKKLGSALRKNIYSSVLDKLVDLGFDKRNVALCKETEALWRDLGLNPGNHPQRKGCRCNCTW